MRSFLSQSSVSPWPLRGVVVTLLLAAALPLVSQAQSVSFAGATPSVNFGTANVCSAGQTTPAPCSQSMTLTYNVTESGTLGTPQALTLGALNLDYKVASGSTCTGSVIKGNTCSVNVAFAPTLPGARNGAVEIVDASGNIIATTLIYGTGVGPRVSFSQHTQTTINAVSSGPMVVDGSGNIFTIGDAGDIEELLAVNGSVPGNPVVKPLPITLADGLIPDGVTLAIDGAGNLFFSASPDYQGGGGYVAELVAAGGYATSKILSGSLPSAAAIAVDGSGNIFFADAYFTVEDTYGGAIYEILASSGYTTVKTLAGGTPIVPGTLALDASGNLFASNFDGTGADNMYEFTPADGYTTGRLVNAVYSQGPGEQGYPPETFALDAAGDLYGDIPGVGLLVEFLAVDGVLPENPAYRILPLNPLQNPSFITLDGRGNLYFSDGEVKELPLTTPPTLNFNQAPVGNTSTDSPQSVEIQNQGNAPLDLSALSLNSLSWDLVKGSGSPVDCTASTSLTSGALCNLSISFEPKEAGPLTGAVSLTDNALNAVGSTQSIPLSGIGDASPPPQIASINNFYGAPYSRVVITGNNFGASQGSSAVTFNGVPAPTYLWTGTVIWATVPPTATSGNLVVTVNGEPSNPVSFTVLPYPVVTGISPASGPAGTPVTIQGNNLLDWRGGQTVNLNGQNLQILSASSTAFVVLVPAPYPVGKYSFHLHTNDTGIDIPAFTLTAPTEMITGPQSTNFGSVNVCPSGKTAPAPCSQTLTLTYTASVNSAVGTPRALSTGQPNIDYTLASGSTCSGNLSAGNTCTVKVTFAPIVPGARNGAVEIVDQSGNVLATTYISGTGIGPPLVSFTPQVGRTINTDVYQGPSAFAVDASGNLFVASSAGGSIRELLAVSGSIPSDPVTKYLPISSGHVPCYMAVDGEGNLFYEDCFNSSSASVHTVVEVPAAGGYSTSRLILTGLHYPAGIAVDGSGNVFVADAGNSTNVAPSVKELFAADSYTTSKTIGGGFQFKNILDITLDGSENLFVTGNSLSTSGNFSGDIEEVFAASGYTTVKTVSDPLSAGLTGGIAIDPVGNLFFSSFSNVYELLAVNGAVPSSPDYLLVANAFGAPLALDGAGNLYVASYLASNEVGIEELQLGTLPPLAFNTTGVGYLSSDSPQSIQIQNRGNAALDVSSLTISANWEEVAGSGTPLDCAASFALNPASIYLTHMLSFVGPLLVILAFIVMAVVGLAVSRNRLHVGDGRSEWIASKSAKYCAVFGEVNRGTLKHVAIFGPSPKVEERFAIADVPYVIPGNVIGRRFKRNLWGSEQGSGYMGFARIPAIFKRVIVSEAKGKGKPVVVRQKTFGWGVPNILPLNNEVKYASPPRHVFPDYPQCRDGQNCALDRNKGIPAGLRQIMRRACLQVQLADGIPDSGVDISGRIGEVRSRFSASSCGHSIYFRSCYQLVGLLRGLVVIYDDRSPLHDGEDKYRSSQAKFNVSIDALSFEFFPSLIKRIFFYIGGGVLALVGMSASVIFIGVTGMSGLRYCVGWALIFGVFALSVYAIHLAVSCEVSSMYSSTTVST